MRGVVADRRAEQLTIVTKRAKMVGDAQRRTKKRVQSLVEQSITEVLEYLGYFFKRSSRHHYLFRVVNAKLSNLLVLLLL